jgi:hypothetical protein
MLTLTSLLHRKDNPTKASFMEVFRAFFVSVMNWIDNLTWFLPLNDQKSLVTMLYSDIDRLLSS